MWLLHRAWRVALVCMWRSYTLHACETLHTLWLQQCCSHSSTEPWTAHYWVQCIWCTQQTGEHCNLLIHSHNVTIMITTTTLHDTYIQKHRCRQMTVWAHVDKQYSPCASDSLVHMWHYCKHKPLTLCCCIHLLPYCIWFAVTGVRGEDSTW
jgi:hypothetical protein